MSEKMEHLRPEEGRYVKDDHAVASARALNGWIMECGGEKATLEFRAVVDAVRNHHRSVNEPDSLLGNLKRADTAAREEEFSGRRKNPRAAATPSRGRGHRAARVAASRHPPDTERPRRARDKRGHA